MTEGLEQGILIGMIATGIRLATPYLLAALGEMLSQRAGVFTGVWAAGETVALALGPAVVGLILAATGFISSEGGNTVTQPDSALTGIVLSFSLFPAAMLLLSLPSLFKYDLTENRLNELRGSHDSAAAS